MPGTSKVPRICFDCGARIDITKPVDRAAAIKRGVCAPCLALIEKEEIQP